MQNPFSSSDGTTYHITTTASTGKDAVRRASPGATTADIENVYRHVDSQVGAVRAELSAMKKEVKSDISTLIAELKSAEADRKIELHGITSELAVVTKSLPSTGTIWRAAGATVGGLVAAAALAWAIFSTGAGLSGAFADEVLEVKSQQDVIDEKLDRLLSKDEEGGEDGEGG